jgi:hypothetical protein
VRSLIDAPAAARTHHHKHIHKHMHAHPTHATHAAAHLITLKPAMKPSRRALRSPSYRARTCAGMRVCVCRQVMLLCCARN